VPSAPAPTAPTFRTRGCRAGESDGAAPVSGPEPCAHVASRPSDTELNPQRPPALGGSAVLPSPRRGGVVMAASRLQTSPHAICRPTAAGRRQEVLACALIATAGDTSTRTAQGSATPGRLDTSPRISRRATESVAKSERSSAAMSRRIPRHRPTAGWLRANPAGSARRCPGPGAACRSSAASKARDGVEVVRGARRARACHRSSRGKPQAALAQPVQLQVLIEREVDTGHFLQFAAGSGGHVDDVQCREERRKRGSPAG
jgi:hypothetical protein